jgi:TonB family protein
MEFDCNGVPTKFEYPGYWSITSPIRIESLERSGNKISITAIRLAAAIDPTTKKFSYEHELDRVTIDISCGDESALGKVLADPDSDLAEALPLEWRRYVAWTGGRSPFDHPKVPCPKNLQICPSSYFRIQGTTMMAYKMAGRDPDLTPAMATFRPRESRILIWISKQGLVQDAAILVPAGYGFDEAALAAVRGWKYMPYHLNGEPIEVETVVTFKF